MSHFFLKKEDREKLTGVDRRLIEVVQMAKELTEIDFIVVEGVRDSTTAKALQYAGIGDGEAILSGSAVILGAWVGNAVRHDWQLYRPIALAMMEAAQRLGFTLRCGLFLRWKRNPGYFELITAC